MPFQYPTYYITFRRTYKAFLRSLFFIPLLYPKILNRTISRFWCILFQKRPRHDRPFSDEWQSLMNMPNRRQNTILQALVARADITPTSQNSKYTIHCSLQGIEFRCQNPTKFKAKVHAKW